MNATNFNDLKKETQKTVEKDSELKEYLVNYVGNYINKEASDEITVDMIVEVMSKEFPEFVLAMAEENFMRGYEQSIKDYDFFKGLEDNETNNSKEK